MLTEKEFEIEMNIYKGLIKLARKLNEYKKSNKSIFKLVEECIEKDNEYFIFCIGVLMGILLINSPFHRNFIGNLNYLINKGIEKSDSELLREYERIVREAERQEFTAYGG